MHNFDSRTLLAKLYFWLILRTMGWSESGRSSVSCPGFQLLGGLDVVGMQLGWTLSEMFA